MKRVLSAIGPIALLTGGCVERAYTPSELVPSAQPEPESRVVQVPARDEVTARWQLPTASPWAPYVKYTLLSALDTAPRTTSLPDVASLGVVQKAIAAGGAIAASGLPRDAMWIVDMRGAASVAFASAISHGARQSVATVPTFNNWPAEDEVVPAEETLAAMVAWPPRLPAEDDRSSRPMFVLDAWRLAFKEDEIEEEATDNRYMLSRADFPSATDLQANGISRVIYVVEDAGDVQHEEDDLHELFLAYQAEGIQIAIVDLAFFTLVRPADEPPWPAAVDTRVVVIEPRYTIIGDPRFYIRAHGGFGGVHGAPYMPHHGHGGGWGGYGHLGGHGGG